MIRLPRSRESFQAGNSVLLLPLGLIDPARDLHPAQPAHVFSNPTIERFSNPLTVLCRAQALFIPWIATKETSARIDGIFAPINTTKGAFFTPRLRRPGFLDASPLCKDRCTSEANSRDSSTFSFSAIFFTRSCNSWIDLSEAAFSRAATSRASGEEVKFR